jgi:hypothetical protein
VEWRGDGASGRRVGSSYTAVGQLQSIQTEIGDQCLMVRRWRLIGHFPILYNPPTVNGPR